MKLKSENLNSGSAEYLYWYGTADESVTASDRVSLSEKKEIVQIIRIERDRLINNMNRNRAY